MNKSNSCIKQAIDSGSYRVDSNGNVYKKTKRGERRVVPQFHKAYGRYRVRINGDKVYLHRVVAYAKFGNELFLSSTEVHHIDGNPFNNHPDNLELTWRGHHLARFHSGEANTSARLTWERVRLIRKLWTTGLRNYAELGRMFNVSSVTIKKVIDGSRWKIENDPAFQKDIA